MEKQAPVGAFLTEAKFTTLLYVENNVMFSNEDLLSLMSEVICK